MLGSFRKFSGSIYAKILLGIIVIPFIFWGMGSSFSGGSKNVIVKIDREKYSIEDFVEYMQTTNSPDKKITENQIEELLSVFIGNILVQKEIESYNIKISDKALSELLDNLIPKCSISFSINFSLMKAKRNSSTSLASTFLSAVLFI